MNTINPVRPYVTLRNNPQPSTEQTTQSPAFKGALGDTVVKKIANKEALKATGIVAMAAGLIGLSKDKVNDIVESLVDRIYGLQNQNDALTKELQETKESSMQKENNMRAEFAERERNLRNTYGQAINQKDTEMNIAIAEKDAKIAELQKYEGMAKVKSVDELDIVSPEQFIELLKEAEDAEQKAEQSLLNYLFNGNGQEEFLAQMERSNKILKARSSGITEIPEMKEAFEGSKIYIGFSPAYVAQQMMANALKNNEAGAQVNYAPIRKQIQENADAIINPMMKKNYNYQPNEKILEEVSYFYKKLSEGKAKMAKDGWKFEKKSVNSSNIPYYTYVNDKNEKYDIYLSDLASGSFGFGRKTLADGTVFSHMRKDYWE